MAAALPEDEEGIGNQGFWDVVSQLLGKGVDCGACCGPRNGQGERSEYAEAWRLKTDRAAYRSEEDEAFNLWNARYWENRNGEQGADRHGAVPMRASNLPGNANRSKALPHCGNSTTPRGLAQQEVGSRHALEEPGSGPSRFAQDKQNRHMHSAHHALHKAPPEAEHNYLSFLPGEHVEVHRHHHSSVKHHGSDPHAEHHAQDYAHHSDPHPQHHHHNPSSSHHHSPKNNSVHQSQDHGHLTHHTQHSAVAFHGSGGSHGLLHDHSEHHFQHHGHHGEPSPHHHQHHASGIGGYAMPKKKSQVEQFMDDLQKAKENGVEQARHERVTNQMLQLEAEREMKAMKDPAHVILLKTAGGADHEIKCLSEQPETFCTCDNCMRRAAADGSRLREGATHRHEETSVLVNRMLRHRGHLVEQSLKLEAEEGAEQRQQEVPPQHHH